MLRLLDSVPPMHVNYCTNPCTMLYFMHVTEYVRLITELETAQSSHLSCASNLRASWPKKILLLVSYDSTATRAVPHVAFFFCKTRVLLLGTSFCTHWLPLFELLSS